MNFTVEYILSRTLKLIRSFEEGMFIYYIAIAEASIQASTAVNVQ